jgi:spermidine synthase
VPRINVPAQGTSVQKLSRQPDLILALFTATLFASALQLFAVQPMFAKMVLPRLGGAPSVWAVSMCFFQAALLLGYAYAHGLIRFVSPAVAASVHVLVLAAAVLALPIALPASWSEPPAGDAYFWLIGLLCVGVGLPFFALSASAPLLQAWFSRTGHPHAADPYFLYGASNFGSMIALVLYPVLVEPGLGLASQSQLWSAGFVMLALLVVGCATITLMNRQEATIGAGFESEDHATGATDDARPAMVGWERRFEWMFLSFVPSALIIAVTNHITTDIASAPLLWVVPLALYLLTFIVVFRDPPSIPHKLVLVVQPLLVAAALGAMHSDWDTRLLYGTGIMLAGFFATTLIAHRELYLQRPAASRLTEFYLWMSVGGVLGGIFSSLVAPQIFSSVIEFPILMLLGLACRPSIIAPQEGRRDWLEVAVVMVVGAGIIGGGMHLHRYQLWTGQIAIGAMLLALFAGLAIAIGRYKPRLEPALLLLMAFAFVLVPPVVHVGESLRSFFGVYRVLETEDTEFRLLQHGTTIHGAQRIRTSDGSPQETVEAISYYYAGSPMARGIEVARLGKGDENAPVRIGVIGLGTGSMACHAEAGDQIRFFEIDPLMVAIATDPQRFSFLGTCQKQPDIVLGDARLTMAKEASGSFDYIVVDAFSSDAIPVHLLTMESIKLYFDKLGPKGVLAVHVSNRHLELVSVVASIMHRLPGAAGVYVNDTDASGSYDAMRSEVVLLAKEESVLEPALQWDGAKVLEPAFDRPWTDDYSGVFQALMRRHWK